MTTTVRENCLVAFRAQLQNAGLTVYRNRDVNITRDIMPCLVMVEGSQSADQSSFYKQINHIDVAVEVYARATSDDSLGPAISDLYGKITTAVMADRQLGGTSVDCVVAAEAVGAPIIERAEGKPPTAAFIMSFIVEFHTSPTDPTVAA